MQKLIFTLLLALVAFVASAQPTTTTINQQNDYYYTPVKIEVVSDTCHCIEIRPEYTKTADEQLIQCRPNHAKVMLDDTRAWWPVYMDLRTFDVFALQYVEGKGWHRVNLGDPYVYPDDTK